MIVQGAVKPAPGLDFASEPDVRLGSSLCENSDGLDLGELSVQFHAAALRKTRST